MRRKTCRCYEFTSKSHVGTGTGVRGGAVHAAPTARAGPEVRALGQATKSERLYFGPRRGTEGACCFKSFAATKAGFELGAAGAGARACPAHRRPVRASTLRLSAAGNRPSNSDQSGGRRTRPRWSTTCPTNVLTNSRIKADLLVPMSRAIDSSRSSTSGSNLTGNCAPNDMPQLYSSAHAHSRAIQRLLTSSPTVREWRPSRGLCQWPRSESPCAGVASP